MSGISFGGNPAQAGGIMGELMKKLNQQKEESNNAAAAEMNVPRMAKGGKVPSASRRADGCATKGKTRGKMI